MKSAAASASFHGLAIGNQPTLPATAILEIAAAGSRLVCTDDVTEGTSLACVAFSNQRVKNSSTHLRCVVDMITGAVAVTPLVTTAGDVPAAPILTATTSHVMSSFKVPDVKSVVVSSSRASLAKCFEWLGQWQHTPTATAVLELNAEALFLPAAICESLSALQMSAGDDLCGPLQSASCDVVTVPRSTNAAKMQISAQLQGQSADSANATAYPELSNGNKVHGTVQLQQMRFKPVEFPPPAHAFSVGWRRRELQSAPISGAKWLLLSHAHDIGLHTVCNPAAHDRLNAISVRFSPEGENSVTSQRTTAKTELVASSPLHLHWLLKASAPDQLLLIGSANTDNSLPQEPSLLPTSNEVEKSFYLDSLVWAHTARDLAGVEAKVSSITFGQQRTQYDIEYSNSDISSCTAIAASKTRFMEDRPSHGISLDLPGATNARNTSVCPSAQQLQWLLTASKETCAAVRHGDLLVERLSASVLAPKPRRGLKLRADMCCVVTGGTKGLGLQYAKQLAREGCKKLVLTSRSGILAPEDEAWFEALGASVVVRPCDASKPEDCAALATWLRENMAAVQIFAHAAGVLSFDLLPDMSPEAFEASVLPKAVGANALVAAGLPVEASLLFSSTASVWSQAGAAHYSAGNACLDAAAQWWQNAGLPGTAVNFGPFGADGMAASLG